MKRLKLLKETLENLEQESFYKNYLEIREIILRLLEQKIDSTSDLPSHYWEEELAGFTYMLDASPLIIERLREHSYHISGLNAYQYRDHHQHLKSKLKQRLQDLHDQGYPELFVPESPILGGFGYKIGASLVNIDTLKFYQCLITMKRAGIFESLARNHGSEKTVLEIGAGWGGFAYQMKTLFPNLSYIIIDLPQTMLFSALYLKTLFPDAKVLFVERNNVDQFYKKQHLYDFIFIPHYLISEIPELQLDMTINMVSFQEMRTENIEQYISQTAKFRCPVLYSYNRDRSPHNKDLTRVSSICSTHYKLERHNGMVNPGRTLKQKIKRLVKQSLPQPVIDRIAKTPTIYEYQHLVGYLKN
jgi:hypothetical protein